MMFRRLRLAFCAAMFVIACAVSAEAQDIVSAYTSFDAGRNCRHMPGKDAEDYGRWRCPGYGNLIVHLAAGDQRMQVSFGTSAKRAAEEAAAHETLPAFNSVYSGTVEWRIGKSADGTMRPFATILRWTVRAAEDEERGSRKSTGQTLVVTRLDPGGVCHVGYVDARTPGANEQARKLADEKARAFRCGVDKAN